MTEISVDFIVESEYLRDKEWAPNKHHFGSRAAAEAYYDDIVRLEKAYGTPRNARLFKRTTTVSDWEQVER